MGKLELTVGSDIEAKSAALPPEISAMVANIRREVLETFPNLNLPPDDRDPSCLTNYWSPQRTMAFDDLPSRVQDYIGREAGVMIKNANDEPMVQLYPDQDVITAGGKTATVVPAYARRLDYPDTYARVALKRPRPNPIAKFVFAREKRMANKLMALLDQEPEPVPITRVIAVAKNCILYEWIDCQEGRAMTLEQAKEKGILAPAEYLLCIANITDALHWLHRHGIKYLDISPSNIMISRDKSARLADFSASQLYTDVVDDPIICNAQYYDWEIIALQERHRDALDIADKYALGVLLRTFLLTYGFGHIITDDQNQKSTLALKDRFAMLAPILRISHELRASIFHPYPCNKGNVSDKDPEYHSFAQVSNTLRIVAKVIAHFGIAP